MDFGIEQNKLRFTSPEGYELFANSDTINFLHHGNFGTSREHYKNPNKSVIVMDAYGSFRRIKEVEKTLDAAWDHYMKVASDYVED